MEGKPSSSYQGKNSYNNINMKEGFKLPPHGELVYSLLLKVYSVYITIFLQLKK